MISIIAITAATIAATAAIHAAFFALRAVRSCEVWEASLTSAIGRALKKRRPLRHEGRGAAAVLACQMPRHVGPPMI